MSTLITVLHVIVCLFLMLTVLLQSGKGGGMGAAFGGGNAATVFGGSGASGFLKRLTAIAGTIFMITSMVLAFLSSRGSNDSLDSFGKDQDEAAKRKEQLKLDAIKAKKAGAGSAVTPDLPPGMTPPPAAGSAVTPPAAGSAVTPPAAGSGSAVTPPAAGSGSAAVTPPAAGSGSAALKPPAEQPPAAGSGSGG